MDKRRFIFLLEDGTKLVYEAESLVDAMEMKVRDVGDMPWTMEFSKPEENSND